MKQLTLTDCDIRLSRFYTQFTALIWATGYSQRSGRPLTISYSSNLGGRISVPQNIYRYEMWVMFIYEIFCLIKLYVWPIGRKTCKALMEYILMIGCAITGREVIS